MDCEYLWLNTIIRVLHVEYDIWSIWDPKVLFVILDGHFVFA